MRWRRLVYGGHRRRHARRSSKDSGGGLLVLAIVVFGLLSYAASYVGWPAVIVALVVVAVLTGRYLIRKVTLSTPKAQDLSLSLQNVGAMSGGQFEVFVAQVLRALGYRTTVLGGSGDQGVDIIAASENGKVAVQCKNYKKPVGNKPVQEVYAGSKHHRCDHAWVVAPVGYTKGAYELAQSVGVSLFDAGSLRKWIKRIDEAEKQAIQQASQRPSGAVTKQARESTLKEQPLKEQPIMVLKTGFPAIDVEVLIYEREVEIKSYRLFGRPRLRRIRYDQIEQVSVEYGRRRASLIIDSTSEGTVKVESLSRDAAEKARDTLQGLRGGEDQPTTTDKPRDTVEQEHDSEQQEEKATASGMEKHTISVGTETLGETVRFTAKLFGTVEANGGSQGGGMDITFYRLPDHTYRALVEREDISILEPSNFVEVFGTDQPAEYGRWTLEELQSLEFYGEAFTKLMVVHPEGKKRNVRDLD